MGGGGEVKKRVTPFLRPHGPPFALLSDFTLVRLPKILPITHIFSKKKVRYKTTKHFLKWSS